MEWTAITIAFISGAAGAWLIQNVIWDIHSNAKTSDHVHQQNLSKSLAILIKLAEKQERALDKMNAMQVAMNRNLLSAGSVQPEPPKQESTS